MRVADESMMPALRPGDRLLIDPGAFRGRLPRAGDVVVLDDPEHGVRWLVKRVAAVDGATGEVDVRGDAADRSRDSRQFGPVPLRTVLGRAYRIYFPVERRRRL